MTQREKLHKDFKVVKTILEKYGIKWFAIQGTCLGAVREGDFIEWDDDVDLAGFMTKEQEAQIREDLRKEGFKVEDDYCIELPKGCTKVEGYIRAIRYTLVDLFRILEDNEGYFVNDIGKCYFRKGTVEWALKKLKLGEEDCYVPNPPENHLISLFGEDWKTPKKTILENHYTPIL